MLNKDLKVDCPKCNVQMRQIRKIVPKVDPWYAMAALRRSMEKAGQPYSCPKCKQNYQVFSNKRGQVYIEGSKNKELKNLKSIKKPFKTSKKKV